MSALTMLLLKLLIITLTLSNHINSGHNVKCPKGHRVSINRGCDACPDGSYQPDENRSQQCKPCTTCEKIWGSSIKEECTKETDRKCQCQNGFVPLETDASTCECPPGFGLANKVCSECEDGFFNNRINSPCQKWKECKSGVTFTGNRTSDVICNDLTNDTNITKRTVTQSTSRRPLEENQTTHTMSTITATPPHRVTEKEKVEPTFTPSTGNYIGMALLLFGITGLLILTVLTCKLHITPCVRRKRARQTNDSCRRPVEESGNSLSSRKLNLEEP